MRAGAGKRHDRRLDLQSPHRAVGEHPGLRRDRARLSRAGPSPSPRRCEGAPGAQRPRRFFDRDHQRGLCRAIGLHRGRQLAIVLVGGNDRAGGSRYIGNLYRDTKGFPDQIGEQMRTTLKDYTETVIRTEWPVQRQGEVPGSGWKPLYKLHGQLISFEPETRREAIIEAEFLRVLNELYKAREARLTAAAGHIPVVIWWIIAIGGAVTTAFTYLFGFESFRLHLTMTGAVAGLAVACRRADRRARLAVPRRGQRRARGLCGCRAQLDPDGGRHRVTGCGRRSCGASTTHATSA